MAVQPISPYVPPASVAPTSRVPSSVAAHEAAETEPPKKDEATASTPPSREQLDHAMGEVKRALAPVARNLQFSIDDETGRSVVKVVDAATNEVIRQMPSEELLAITRSMDKFSGLFVKQKA
jgi:flagellar protein FlaG